MTNFEGISLVEGLWENASVHEQLFSDMVTVLWRFFLCAPKAIHEEFQAVPLEAPVL